MNIRNMAAFALVIAATCPSLASEHQTPLYQSVLNADESQIQSREPLALTEVASLEQSNETNSNQLITRNTHVVMLSERGYSILERTANGLVKRDEEFFKGTDYYGTRHAYASPDGKTLVWQTNSGLAELKINADFSANHKKLSGFASSSYIVTPKSADSFLIYNYQTSRYTAYQVTDAGLKLAGELPASQELQNSSFLYNSKDQILVSTSNNYWNKIVVIVFKVQNGVFTESARQELITTNSTNYAVYDTDTGRLVFQTYSAPYHVLQVNGSSGTIESVGTTTERLVDVDSFHDFNGVVSGNYFVANRYNTQYLLYRDGNVFRDRTSLDESEGTMTTHYNSETGRQEYWHNSRWSLEAYTVNQNNMTIVQERTSKQRGFPLLERSTMLGSDDNHYVLVQDGFHRVLLALDENKLLKEVYRTGVSRTEGNIGYNSQFINVGKDTYLISDANNYRIVSIDNNGWVVMSEPKNWPPALGYYLNDPKLKFKDGYIFLVSNGLTVLQLKNETLSVVHKLDDAALNAQEQKNIRAVVELNGNLFALMPASGKIAKLKFKNNLLSVEKTGSMPNIEGPYHEGNNRVYASNYQGAVLFPDADENLKINAFAREWVDGIYYKKRLKVARNFQNDQTTFMLNDDITGVWQPLTLNGDCCQPGSGLQVLDGHLLALVGNNRQTLKIFKMNSAPYLPAVVNPIQLNQGVSAEVDIAGFIRDDENQPLSYSGLSAASFTITDTNKLKFDGIAHGKGAIALTVSDGELLSELKLPYQINAAPALLKPLNTVIANQNAQFLLDLNDFIEDPEGSAISFQTQSQNGIQLSKSGLVSGTANTVQNISFALKVTDKAGAVLTTNLQVQVNAAPALTGNASLTAKVGQSFAIDLNTLITDAEKHRINLAVTALPAGLSINGAVISGTPTAQGSSSVQLTATDELGARSVTTLTLNIAAEDKKSGGSLGWAWLVLLMLAQIRRRYS